MKSKTITELGILKRRVGESLRERLKYQRWSVHVRNESEEEETVVPGPGAEEHSSREECREAA